MFIYFSHYPVQTPKTEKELNLHWCRPVIIEKILNMFLITMEKAQVTVDSTIDSGYQGKEALDITERKVGFPDLRGLTPVRDIEIVKAQYIIDNI